MTEPTFTLRGGHPGAATALRFYASLITDDPAEAAACQRLAIEFDDYRRGRGREEADLGDGLTGSRAPEIGHQRPAAMAQAQRAAAELELSAAGVALCADDIRDNTRPCRSCEAPIFDALLKSRKHPDGHKHPVNVERAANGNLVFDTDGRMQVSTPTGGWVSHFATCPDAGKWRAHAPK